MKRLFFCSIVGVFGWLSINSCLSKPSSNLSMVEGLAVQTINAEKLTKKWSFFEIYPHKLSPENLEKWKNLTWEYSSEKGCLIKEIPDELEMRWQKRMPDKVTIDNYACELTENGVKWLGESGTNQYILDTLYLTIDNKLLLHVFEKTNIPTQSTVFEEEKNYVFLKAN